MPAAGDKPTGQVVLIRPDGHIAAHGKPGSMDAVTGYLRDLFREPSRSSDLSVRLKSVPADALPCLACGKDRRHVAGRRKLPGLAPVRGSHVSDHDDAG
jgi:hypothetical protein